MASNFEEAKIRTFETGATRDADTSKPDYEGFLSPLVLTRYGQYMNRNRVQPDGSIRASDNWQLGIPLPAYMSSLWRHMMELFTAHDGYFTEQTIESILCAILFNASGYLHELLKRRGYLLGTNWEPERTFEEKEMADYAEKAQRR